MWASPWTGAINPPWPCLVPALGVGDLFSSSMLFGVGPSGFVEADFPDCSTGAEKRKVGFQSCLGRLFPVPCVVQGCLCWLQLWNGVEWRALVWVQRKTSPCTAWMGLLFSDFQIRERAAGGEFQGKGLCIREENGFGFKCSSSLCPVERICKTYQKQNIKSISSSEQLTPLALLFLDVLTHSPSLLSPKGCSYSVLCVAFEISKATCVREKGISRRREASSAWWCLEPTAGPWPGALSLFYGSAPFPWGFSAECWMHWMVPLSCSLWPFPEAGQCSQVQQGPGQQPLQPGRNSSSLGKGCALSQQGRAAWALWDKDAAGGAGTTSHKNGDWYPAPGQWCWDLCLG